MQKHIQLLLLFLLLSLPLTSFAYGLKIRPNAEPATTLLPDNGRPIRLRDELTISFRFHIDTLLQGSVMKIITNRDELFAITLQKAPGGALVPTFIINDQPYTFPLPNTQEKWISAGITLSPLNKRITLIYEGKQKPLPYTFEKRTYLRTAFGYCPFEGYESAETAAVTLRDIRLQQNGFPLRYWQLEAHADTVCYDSVAYMPASVINPWWIVNNGSAVTPDAYRQVEPDDTAGYAIIWKMLLFVGGVFVLTAIVMQFLYLKNRKRLQE